MFFLLCAEKVSRIIFWLCVNQMVMLFTKEHQIVDLINLVLCQFITVPGAGRTDSMNMCKLRKVCCVSIFRIAVE